MRVVVEVSSSAAARDNSSPSSGLSHSATTQPQSCGAADKQLSALARVKERRRKEESERESIRAAECAAEVLIIEVHVKSRI